MKRNIKILVCYHKPDVLLKDDVFTPIHVGRALARRRGETEDFRWMCEKMIGDDTGENISEKNASYNELTALYWAWKNYSALGDPEYIGLMHYRRHFIFRRASDVVEEVDGIDDGYFRRINYSEDTVAHLFDDCDFVAHVGRVGGTIYEHYAQNHHVEDLDRALNIVRERYPRFRGSVARYLRSSEGNFFNMFIFPKEVFFDYCAWIFDVLSRFEREVDLSEKRLFISERLTAVYIEQLRREGLRQKSLSATFVRAPERLPAAVPYRASFEFCTAAAMCSLLENVRPDTRAEFYVLHRAEEAERARAALSPVGRRYKNCVLRFVDIDEVLRRKGLHAAVLDLPRQYPLVVPDAMEGEGKALYLDERCLFGGDAAHFFRLCNADEFAALCLPPHGGRCEEGLFVLNCARLRRKGVLKHFRPEDAALPSEELFARAAQDRVGRVPPSLYTSAEPKGGGVRRGMLLYFGENALPWEGVLSSAAAEWWRAAQRVPAGVPFGGVSPASARRIAEETAEVCSALGRELPAAVERVRAAAGSPRSSWSEFMAKGMRYLREHGVLLTAKKTISVLIGKANGKS